MDSLAYMLASGGDDDSLKLWFWLIVGAIFLIKKVIEFLKPKEKDEETPVLDTEDHHEKRVKEVIAEMRRTNPQPRQPQPGTATGLRRALRAPPPHPWSFPLPPWPASAVLNRNPSRSGRRKPPSKPPRTCWNAT